MVNGWLVFGALVAAYLAAYLAVRGRERRRALKSAPLLENGALATPEHTSGLATAGPLLLWRTQFGKRWMEAIARPGRFWNVVADAGIVLTWIMGILLFALLLVMLVQYITAPEQSASNAPGVRELLGIPGVNPMIPLGYGIAALVLALVIHEGSHGVMAYVAKMRVKSLGLVMLVIPIGAFVEPHDEDMMRATTRARNRVFAAGPTSNVVLAVVAGVLLSTLFVGPMVPVNDGEGVLVGGVAPESAAQVADLRAGDVIVALGGQPVRDRAAYTSIVTNMSAGDTVAIDFIRSRETRTTQAVLGDRYEQLKRQYPELEGQEGGYNDTDKGKAYLGVTGLDLAGGSFPGSSLDNQRQALASPFASLPNFLYYISYPLFIFTTGVDVLASPYNDLFLVSGPMAFLPDAVFFGTASLLYWIVWLNLMLGTFNALPAGPLDGGQMFRATLAERMMRRYQVDQARLEVERSELGGLALKGKDEETQRKLDRVNLAVSRATRTLGFFILGLILLPVFAPPIVRLLMG